MTAAASAPDRSLLPTTYSFELPVGYESPDGTRFRTGVMRLATARDEIMPLRDSRVRDNEAYLTVLLLARVVEIDGVSEVTPRVIEDLYACDLSYLQDMYREINGGDGGTRVVTCPSCGHEFQARGGRDAPGES